MQRDSDVYLEDILTSIGRIRDHDIVWDVVVNKLPGLEVQVSRLLGTR